METEARRGPTAILSPGAGEPATIGGLAAVTVEPALPECVRGLNKTQAEELLDWLEINGHPSCELSFEPQTGFTVRLR
jgi:hypothetical protein